MTEDAKRDQRYLYSFLAFYFIILASWLFFMIFHFTTYFRDDSFVVAQYLFSGEEKVRTEIATTWQLTTIDVIVKINMILVAIFLSTIFLIYNILPKMKSLNVWWMILGAVAAYLPSLLTLISVLTGTRLSTSLWFLENYLTINKFLTLLVLYPLNFAVFFYLYYLIETFVLQPGSKKTL